MVKKATLLVVTKKNVMAKGEKARKINLIRLTSAESKKF